MIAQNGLAVAGRRAGDFWIFWTGQTTSQRDLLITCFTPMGSPNWHTLSVQTG